ncbi:MAG: hypothetical protein O7H40_03115, partial [Gammaproteobacteria bacterium]|nr:hypothetical protein [Gammaproteobacteria bacterium]
ISEHHEDDRWDKFSSGDPWKYGAGLGGNAQMKADYHRIANAFRGRCIEFRMIAYYDFHIVGGATDPDRVDTTYWDVLYMISGAEAHGQVPWYGPFIDVVHSAEAWHFWHARFHGFSADLKDLGGGYNVEFTNIYSDEATAEFSYSGAFDNGGGAEAWIEYFFASRIGTDIYDANPIHMIVECLTNPTWGMGYPFSALEMSSFRDAACTLFDEQFGLSMMWTQQDTIENFVKEIIDHIEAALYINPETGLFEVKLIRFDYDINQLPRLDPTNMTVKRAATRLVSEAINEITVEWTNPLNEKKETVTLQDLGGVVACNGIIKSETRNYYGIRRVALATEVVRRDIRSASAPITTMEVEVDRAYYNALPAQVLEVVYPEHQIFGSDPLIMRVLAADYGKPGASKIILSLSEDIFSLSPHFFDVAPGTELVNVSTPPSEMDDGQVITFPYFFAANAIDAAAAAAAAYPDVFVGVLVAEADQGSISYNLFGDTSDPAGGSTQEDFGERDCLAKGTLQAALLWEAETLVPDWGVLSNGTGPIVGGIVLIGDPADDETVREMALLSAEASGVWTIKRGVLDTVPRAWAAGTEIWFMSLEDDFADPETRAAGEDVDYVAQIIATGGVLPVSTLTPIPTYTLTERPHLPSRPADVKVDTVAFADKFYLVKPATVDVTWAGRNRVTEDAQILAWTDAGIPVEVGQTVEIEVYDAGLALIHTFTGLTGGTASLDETEFDQAGISTLRFYAKVGTFRSLQYYEVRVDTRGDVGYGSNYGFDYGGT